MCQLSCSATVYLSLTAAAAVATMREVGTLHSNQAMPFHRHHLPTPHTVPLGGTKRQRPKALPAFKLLELKSTALGISSPMAPLWMSKTVKTNRTTQPNLNLRQWRCHPHGISPFINRW